MKRVPSQIAASVCLIGLANFLIAFRTIWAAETVAVVIWLTVPGFLAVRATRLSSSPVHLAVYVPALSICFLAFVGLIADVIGATVGFRGLRALPLALSYDVGLVILGWLARPSCRALGPKQAERLPIGAAAFLILPALSAGGALLLSNGRGNSVAIAGVIVVGITMSLGLMFSKHMSPSVMGVLVFSSALALLWSFALRGQSVYGFDVATELHIAQTVQQTGVWHPSHRNDAYGAMLSLTVLPASLRALTGVSALISLKVLYPALFALFPVALFALALRFVRPSFALAAATFLIFQNYFFQTLPGITRQEIGLVLFAALILVLFERQLNPLSRLALITTLGAATVVSHYSTTYFLEATLILAVIGQCVLSVAFRRRAVSWAAVVAVFVVGTSAIVWYGPVTHSAQNLSSFSDAITNHGLDLFPASSSSQGLVDRYLSGNAPLQVSATSYERQASALYRQEHPGLHPLSSAVRAQYRLVGTTLGAGPSALVDRLNAANSLITQIAYLLAGIGTLISGIRARREKDKTLALFAAFSAATIFVVAFLRLSGVAAQAYGQQRAFVQTTIPLAICIAVSLQSIATRLPRLPWRLASLIPIFILACTSQVVSATSQGSGLANLENHGRDYDQFVYRPTELAAATWLGAVPTTQPVFADPYGALRLAAATGRTQGVFEDITPGTVSGSAWVYARAANVSGDYAQGSLGSQRYAVFRWPAFVLDLFGRVYTNNQAAVYHR